jgi:plastocyanin
MRRLLFICGCVIALLAAGCGSSGGGSTSSAPASTPAPASTSGGQSSGAVAKVDMHNIQFSPKTLTVKAGTTVEWTNDDSVNHDVTKQTGPGPQFSSGTGDLGSGATYKVTFKTPGTVKYECTVHPGMTGTIVVK